MSAASERANEGAAAPAGVVEDVGPSEARPLQPAATTTTTAASESSEGAELSNLVKQALLSGVPSKASQIRIDAYRRRLRTFSPATYFAKPPSISPVACARLGYANDESKKDVLVCCQCRAVLVVFFPQDAGLPIEATTRLTRLYETKLRTAHKDTCMYRKEAELLEGSADAAVSPVDGALADAESATEDESKDNELQQREQRMLPALYEGIVPPSVRDLLEAPSPVKLFRAQWKYWTNVLSKSSDGRLAVANELPQALVDFKIDGDDDERPAFERIVALMKGEDEGGPTQTKGDDSKYADLAVALTLCGWYRCPTKDISAVDVSAECPFCLSRFDVTGAGGASKEGVPAEGASEEHQPPHKRRRTTKPPSNPLDAHRYYCPYACGFPVDGATEATPLWRSLAERLLKSAATAASSSSPADAGAAAVTSASGLPDDAAEAYLDIHRMLRCSLSPRFRRDDAVGTATEPTNL